MIYELRTYTIKPGSAAEFEARWAPLIAKRQELSPLTALWRTEMGALNQMIHVWSYESLDERNRIRALAVEQKIWPPNTGDLLVSMDSQILLPAPFMRQLAPGHYGNFYEMRIYTYQVGTIPEVLRLWGEAVPFREQHSPLAACWYSDIGRLNTFIHVWPYESFAERDRIRAEAAKGGHWPAPTGQWIVSQETKILIPAAFSSLR